MLSPEDIDGREFLVSLRGYDREQVDGFRKEVAAQLRHCQLRIAELESALAERPPATAGEPLDHFAEIGHETRRILEAAEEAGQQLRIKARQDGERELERARSLAAEEIAEAERRRAALEQVVSELEGERERLADEVRAIARSAEQVLRTLHPAPESTAGARDASPESARAAEATRPGLRDAEPPQRGMISPPSENGDSPLTTVVRAHVVAGNEAATASEAESPGEPAGPAAQPEAAVATDEQGAEDRRRTVLQPLQPTLARRLKRGLQELQNVALDGIRRARAHGDVADFLPGDGDLAALSRLAGEQLAAAYRAGAAAGAAAVGRPASGDPPPDPAVEARFRGDAAERIQAQLGGTLRVGLEAGERLPDLSDRVGTVFAELRGATVEEFASIHLVHAYERGVLTAWKEAGVPARSWMLGREARCPEARCRQNSQAGPIPLDKPFPSGHESPPLHPGCSCTAAPILESSDA